MKVVELSNDTVIHFFARQRAAHYALYLRNRSTNNRVVFNGITVTPTNTVEGTNSHHFTLTGPQKTEIGIQDGQMVDFAIYGADNANDFTDPSKNTVIYQGTVFGTDQTINQQLNQVFTQNEDNGTPIYKERETGNEYIIYE